MSLTPRPSKKESGTTPDSARYELVKPGTAVSPERAEALKLGWAEAWLRWSDAATSDELDRWAETFAPDHPEWFEKDA